MRNADAGAASRGPHCPHARRAAIHLRYVSYSHMHAMHCCKHDHIHYAVRLPAASADDVAMGCAGFDGFKGKQQEAILATLTGGHPCRVYFARCRGVPKLQPYSWKAYPRSSATANLPAVRIARRARLPGADAHRRRQVAVLRAAGAAAARLCTCRLATHWCALTMLSRHCYALAPWFCMQAPPTPMNRGIEIRVLTLCDVLMPKLAALQR